MPDKDDPHSIGSTSTLAGPPAEAADPLAKLHRMSRTAGLGTQDYVAVNVMAVTAFLLGVAGALSLLFGLLLVIPLAGVICAIVGLWQIRDSNGTQMGRGWAWSGLILSLAFISIVGTRRFVEDMRTRSDKQAVMKAVEELGSKLAASDFAAAYEMAGPHFRERVAQQDFEGQLRSRYNYPRHGKVTSMRSNGNVMFDPDEEGGNLFATTKAIIELSGRTPDEQQLSFLKQGDRWVIESFGWFPPKPLVPAARGSGP